MQNTALRAALLAALAGLAGGAHAQAKNPLNYAADPLSWHGLTVYGLIDLGLASQSDGVAYSRYYSNGIEYIPARYGAQTRQTAFTNNALSNSVVGLQGEYALAPDWTALFKLETAINPASGEISNGIKSLIVQNGVPFTHQIAAADSSLSGQIFSSTAIAGLYSKTYGAFTFGWQNAVIKDILVADDPQGHSYAFSPVGGSGTISSGGSTEDARLADAIIYRNRFFDTVRVAALWAKASQQGNGAAEQLALGLNHGGLALDVVYAEKKDAIAASSYAPTNWSSATGIQLLEGTAVSSAANSPINYGYNYGVGGGGHDEASVSNSVVGTVSDNTAWVLAGKYKQDGPLTYYGGYERIRYTNPSDPLKAGYQTLNGYTLGIVNNNAYSTDKVLDILWAGVKVQATQALTITPAYYHIAQNRYVANAYLGTSAPYAGTNKCFAASSYPASSPSYKAVTWNGCNAGGQGTFSLVGDYVYNAHLDFYSGLSATKVSGGLALGYYNSSVVTGVVGLRARF